MRAFRSIPFKPLSLGHSRRYSPITNAPLANAVSIGLNFVWRHWLYNATLATFAHTPKRTGQPEPKQNAYKHLALLGAQETFGDSIKRWYRKLERWNTHWRL